MGFNSKIHSTEEGLMRLGWLDKNRFKYPGGGGVLPMMAYTGRLRPKGIPFFRLQVYERVGISLVVVCKGVGKSVIWVCKRAQEG